MLSKSKRTNRIKTYPKVIPIQTPIKKRQLLCGLHRPAPEYVDRTPSCAGCEYWIGTKCKDIHAALIASEQKYDNYERLISNNRGVYL